MRWYSVKKYRPPISGIVICRVLDEEHIDEIVCASYSHSCGWTLEHLSIEEHDRFTVTHFAIPDPIEIEQENSHLLPKNLISDED